MLCSEHPKAYRDIPMKEGKVTYPDKLDKEKKRIITEEFLFCPRCYQTVQMTPEIRRDLEEIKNGTAGNTEPTSAPGEFIPHFTTSPA